MDFEWDDAKDWANREKHGVSFERAALIFVGPIVTRIDARRDYGEERFISLGLIGTDVYVVVYTTRGGVTRIISARKGGRHDRQYYHANIARGAEGEA